jgi:hypothetical protein
MPEILDQAIEGAVQIGDKSTAIRIVVSRDGANPKNKSGGGFA